MNFCPYRPAVMASMLFTGKQQAKSLEYIFLALLSCKSFTFMILFQRITCELAKTKGYSLKIKSSLMASMAP